MQLLSVVLAASVLLLVVWQPRGLSIGWPAAAGGAAALALGVVTWADVIRVVAIVWDATLTFVALIFISIVLDEVGFFQWAALWMGRLARGSAPRLFLSSILLGAIVSAFFTNDGAALILTPIVYDEVVALKLPPAAVLAFVMAGGFIADTASLPLVVSNLVNILSADFFHIGFVHYAQRMVPVDLVAVGASLLALVLYFRRSIPAAYDPGILADPISAVRDLALFRRSFYVLGFLMAGYLVSEALHIPVSLVAVGAAAMLLLMARRSAALDLGRVVRAAPWKIVVFSVGMYVVIYGLRDAGLIRVVSDAIAAAGRGGRGPEILATGYLATFLSSTVNNLPTVLVVALGIRGTHAPLALEHMLALANVVGSDLGTKITPIGSLATLLWLHILERRGLRISWGTYMRVGVVLTLPVLAVVLLALMGWLMAIGP